MAADAADISRAILSRVASFCFPRSRRANAGDHRWYQWKILSARPALLLLPRLGNAGDHRWYQWKILSARPALLLLPNTDELAILLPTSYESASSGTSASPFPTPPHLRSHHSQSCADMTAHRRIACIMHLRRRGCRLCSRACVHAIASH